MKPNSRFVKHIADMTATRVTAVNKFIVDNNLDAEALFSYIVNGPHKKGRAMAKMDFSSALSGKPGNEYEREFISKFKLKESINKKSNLSEIDIGDKFKHKHLDGYSAEILDFTNKGYKVKQTEPRGKKLITKTTFFPKVDFDVNKGVWTPIKESNNILLANLIEATPTSDTKKFLKGMQKIKLEKSFSKMYMPGNDYIWWDRASQKLYFVDYEGDYMELRNKHTKIELMKHLKDKNITVESMDKLLPTLKDILNEASQVSLNELPAKAQTKAKKIVKLFYNNKDFDLFDGIHGHIVVIDTGIRGGRLASSDLKSLLSIGIRWVDGKEDSISVGF